jgi:hypothetical protein
MTPIETNSAFASISKLIGIVIRAYPNASHDEIAKQALVAWGEKRDGLADQLTKLTARKSASVTTKASINTKQGNLNSLNAIEPVLNAMLDILRKQGKPAVVKTEVKKAA